MGKLTGKWKSTWPLLLLLVFALGLRLYIYLHMHPVIHTDSISYFFLNELDSVRTPGYPLFIEMILSVNDWLSITSAYFRAICFVQMFLLGILNSLLLYLISRKLTQNIIFSVIMGLLYNLNFFVISFEFQILTETLSTSLILAIVYLYLDFFQKKKFLAVLAGLMFVLLIYTKPAFLLLGFGLPFLTLLVYLPTRKNRPLLKQLIPAFSVFLIINFLGVGAWSLRNKIKYDYMGISSLMPFNLRMYTNQLIHKYQPIGDKKIDHIAAVYAEEHAKTGPISSTYFNFEQRIQAEMQLSEIEISKAFLKINLHLLRTYPQDYFRQVPASVLRYYREYSSYWAAGNIRRLLMNKRPIPSIFKFFFRIYKFIFSQTVLMLLLVLAIPVLVLFLTFKNKKIFHGWLVLEAFIIYNCLVSVLTTDAGINNLRYRAPLEPFILLMFYAGLFYLGKSFVGKRIKKS